MAISVYTYECADGVVGLNGKQWLLDERNQLMLFNSINEARDFLSDKGVDPDGEYIGYEDEEGKED